MFTCKECNGSGWVSYDEDGRWIEDACYHCSNTGVVDEETHRHDRLVSVAYRLADAKERNNQELINNDPDSEGYATHAAECMLSEYDYFTMRVEEHCQQIAEELHKLPVEMQEVLIAWNEYVCVPSPSESDWIVYNETVVVESVPSPSESEQVCEFVFGDDDIPF